MKEAVRFEVLYIILTRDNKLWRCDWTKEKGFGVSRDSKLW